MKFSCEANEMLSLLWRATWQSAVLALLVAVTILVSRRWLAAKWRVVLWMLPLCSKDAMKDIVTSPEQREAVLDIIANRSPTWHIHAIGDLGESPMSTARDDPYPATPASSSSIGSARARLTAKSSGKTEMDLGARRAREPKRSLSPGRRQTPRT